VEPFLSGIHDYVEQGGALAMIGGDLSFASGRYGDTPLQEVLPVELPRSEGAYTTDSFKPKLTAEGRAHPVTSLLLDQRENELRWGKLPALEGVNQVVRLRPGAVPLLVHPTLKIEGGKPAPVLVVGEPGKGRVMALLTDTAWHWGFLAAGEGDDGRAFQHFWENAIRWLVHDPALTLLRVDFDRAEYRRHQSPAVRVRAMHPDYTPASGVAVAATVTPAEAEQTTRPLRAFDVKTDGEGEARVDIGVLPPGAYRLTARATLDRTWSSATTSSRPSPTPVAAPTGARTSRASRSAIRARSASASTTRSSCGPHLCCWSWRSGCWRPSGRCGGGPGTPERAQSSRLPPPSPCSSGDHRSSPTSGPSRGVILRSSDDQRARGAHPGGLAVTTTWVLPAALVSWSRAARASSTVRSLKPPRG
jgi:hypothetical protein